MVLVIVCVTMSCARALGNFTDSERFGREVVSACLFEKLREPTIPSPLGVSTHDVKALCSSQSGPRKLYALGSINSSRTNQNLDAFHAFVVDAIERRNFNILTKMHDQFFAWHKGVITARGTLADRIKERHKFIYKGVATNKHLMVTTNSFGRTFTKIFEYQTAIYEGGVIKNPTLVHFTADRNPWPRQFAGKLIGRFSEFEGFECCVSRLLGFIRSPPSLQGARLRMLCGFFSPMRCTPRGEESAAPNNQANQAKPEGGRRPPCGFSSGVCGLPLGAKIALTVISAGIATAIWSWGYWKFLDGRSNAIKLSIAALVGLIALGLIPALLSWGSTY